MTLVWHKRRWCCLEPACLAGSWTEDRPDIAMARSAMTTRAGLWATRDVGAEIHSVSYAAGQLGVAWHTVMDAVSFWGQALIDDPDRVGMTAAVGVDETKFLAATRDEATQWVSTICDVEQRLVIDVIAGRWGPELEAWLAEQPQVWKDTVAATVTDLRHAFRRALAKHLTNAVAVADPFHVVGVGTRVVDRTRRRVQQETLQHRRHKVDPLYRARKLLTLAAERLDADSTTKLRGLLAAGDPHGQVHEAWAAKEGLRELYTLWGETDTARRWLNGLIDDCRAEVRGMAATLSQWREQILAWHHLGISNGPVEGLNSLIKKVKRVARCPSTEVMRRTAWVSPAWPGRSSTARRCPTACSRSFVEHRWSQGPPSPPHRACGTAPSRSYRTRCTVAVTEQAIAANTKALRRSKLSSESR